MLDCYMSININMGCYYLLIQLGSYNSNTFIQFINRFPVWFQCTCYIGCWPNFMQTYRSPLQWWMVGHTAKVRQWISNDIYETVEYRVLMEHFNLSNFTILFDWEIVGIQHTSARTALTAVRGFKIKTTLTGAYTLLVTESWNTFLFFIFIFYS